MNDNWLRVFAALMVLGFGVIVLVLAAPIIAFGIKYFDFIFGLIL